MFTNIIIVVLRFVKRFSGNFIDFLGCYNKECLTIPVKIIHSAISLGNPTDLTDPVTDEIMELEVNDGFLFNFNSR